jgi:hypothetical protein
MAIDVWISIVILFFGFVLGYLFKRWLIHRGVGGTIHVTKEREKTLYSLELDDYPDTIIFQKEVVFKVDASEQSLDRK